MKNQYFSSTKKMHMKKWKFSNFNIFSNLLYQIWRFKYSEFIRGNHMLSGEFPAKIWYHFIFSKHQKSSFSRSTSYFSMKLSPNYRKHIRSWCNLLSKLQKHLQKASSHICVPSDKQNAPKWASIIFNEMYTKLSENARTTKNRKTSGTRWVPESWENLKKQSFSE